MRILEVDNKVNDQFRFETLDARATSQPANSAQQAPGPVCSTLYSTYYSELVGGKDKENITC